MSADNKSRDTTARQLIDESLKRVYADVEGEELPDRFKDLLDQLKKQDDAKKSKGS